ncbi:hypothetical protein KFE25_007318 [Diacronema lutheri]|uniref:Transmembrane protein n=1 Tax=Diacronema lutheri TaxID=2081491 RepID=A0A8J6CG81_DIALT|nr:hypothetical protein KFE25_007318 [Diacronema lutheri]
MAPFRAVNVSTFDELRTFDDKPFAALTGRALIDVALDFGIRDPALLAEEASLKLILAALAVASGALDGNPSAMSAPSVKWATLESEVRGLLVLTVRSKGCLPHATACALNVLAQPSVVQKYKLRGNRWTEPNNAALDAVDGAAGSVEDEDAPLLDHETLRVLQLAKEQFSDAMSQRSTAEWLQALGAAMDEPMADRPWFHSGGAWIAVGGVCTLLLFHIFVLNKVLGRLSLLNDRQGNSQAGLLVLLPALGLGAAACVGACAVFVHKRI